MWLLWNCFVWNFKNLLKKKNLIPIKSIILMRQDCIGNVSQQKHLLHEQKGQLQATNHRKSTLLSYAVEMLQGTRKWNLYWLKRVRNCSCKGTETKNLLVVYFNQKGVWMTRDIFPWWFHEHFVSEARKHLPQKAVLLLDNATSHPNESLLVFDDELIAGKFLPPNVTVAIQPMDQGVISAIKRFYRFEFSKSLIHEIITLPNFWKQYSLLDMVCEISAAWLKVKSSMLSQSWRKVLPLDERSSTDI